MEDRFEAKEKDHLPKNDEEDQEEYVYVDENAIDDQYVLRCKALSLWKKLKLYMFLMSLFICQMISSSFDYISLWCELVAAWCWCVSFYDTAHAQYKLNENIHDFRLHGQIKVYMCTCDCECDVTWSVSV